MRLFFLSAVAATALTGCAYSFGPVNDQVAGGKTIQVNPVTSMALEPRLSDAVTTSLRKNIQRDGTFRLDSHKTADIIVTGSILHFKRDEVSLQPGDVITPQDYRISIVAHITARERVSGKILMDREVTGSTTVRIGSDLSSAERQAVPLSADDLGRKVASILSEGPWP